MAPISALKAQQVQADIAALAIGGFVAFALIVWDFIAYLPDEIRLLKDFRKVSWRSPDPFCFFVVRYSALSFGLSSLFILALKTDHCALVAALTQAFSMLVLMAAGILAARRMSSLWNNMPLIVSVSTLLYVIMIGSWIAVASQFSGFRVQDTRDLNPQVNLPAFGTNCGIRPLVPWNSLSYIASTIFFGMTFSLSLWHWSRQRTEHVLNLGLTPLNRACLWYLMVSWLGSLAVLIVYTSGWGTDIARRTSSPFFILLVAGMGQRMYLNSQADYTLRKQHIQEMTAMNLKAKIPRWSWSPNAKKMSISTISTNSSPALRGIPLATFNGGGGATTELSTPPVSYPRPPPPPPAYGPSTPASPDLTPLPPQHIMALERSKAGSAASSVDTKPSTPPQGGHHEITRSTSTEQLLTSDSERPAKKTTQGRKKRFHFSASSSATTSGGPTQEMTFLDFDPASVQSTSMLSPSSSFSQGIPTSPSGSVSTMGFGSPPGSPPVLSLPWPGGRPPPNSKKVLPGSKPMKRSNSRGRRGSRSRARNDASPTTPRFSSAASGWVN